MKKIIVALLLTLVGAAVAAPVELKGSLGTEIKYVPEQELAGATNLQLGYLSRLNNNTNAVFGLRWQANRKSNFDWYEGALDAKPFLYAFVEADGAFWEGMQPVKMTMGSLNIDYSPYIATFGYDTKKFFSRRKKKIGPPTWTYNNLNGFSFDQIKLGAINARLFYVFDNYAAKANTYGINFKGAFDALDLNTTFVKIDEQLAYDIAASFSPVQVLDLAGHFLSDGKADEGWYKFQAAYSGIPNWRLATTYRDFSPELEFPYRDTTPSVVDGAFVMPNPYALNQGLKGLILGAATTYAGYDFAGEYDYALKRTHFIASKDNWSAKLKLTKPLDEIESLIVLRAHTTSDVVSLKNIKFEGVAEFGEGAVYGGSATYVAPIGLNVVAEYYSDNLKDDDGFCWIQARKSIFILTVVQVIWSLTLKL